MNGGAESTEHLAQRTEHAGRHRRGRGAGGWTPAVPTQPGAGRHQAAENHTEPTEPLAATISGSLPVPLAARCAGTPYPASHGELPVQVPDRPARGPGEPTTARRRKVTLTPRQEPATEEDVRIYVAPPPDGLGKFDLGSVPASVTPPRSWRRAAWFATGSSGAVVVALLFAGSMLVSQPTDPSPQAIQGWPDWQGAQPTADGEYYEGVPSTGASQSATGNGPTSPDSLAAGSSMHSGLTGAGSGTRAVHPPGRPSGGSGTSTSRTTAPPPATSTGVPRKPPITKAAKSTAPPRQVVTFNPKTMGDRSEDYLNKVTENAAAAHELTTGRLAAGGADGLKRRYADIAYFEVKQIYIDPNQGYTLNEVTVTYNDGSKASQRRTLTFGDGTKIESDSA